MLDASLWAPTGCLPARAFPKEGKQRMLQNNHNFPFPCKHCPLFFYFINKQKSYCVKDSLLGRNEVS